MTPAASPPGELLERVEAWAGQDVVAARRQRGGYTPAERWVLVLDGGASLFAKMAVEERTAAWLEAEHRFYSSVRAEYLPAFLGWLPDGERPVLLLEDLSAAAWPPPWSARRIDEVRRTLEAVAATPPPAWTPLARDLAHEFRGWTAISEQPEPFLSLGLASEHWLRGALPALIEAERSASLDGDALLHFDVRSDNLCFEGGRTVLVDWNLARRGNPLFDLAAWLPSLHAEGGPPPWEICDESHGFSALVAGFFAARAGLPPPPRAPRVRQVQLMQLRSALPWAVRELGLPPPGVSAG